MDERGREGETSGPLQMLVHLYLHAGKDPSLHFNANFWMNGGGTFFSIFFFCKCESAPPSTGCKHCVGVCAGADTHKLKAAVVVWMCGQQIQ